MIKIYGASDDLIELGGDVRDELTANSKERATLRIGTRAGGCIVTMAYVEPGVWEGRVRQIDPGVPIPWSVSVTHEGGDPSGYSVVVTIDCPKGTTVVHLEGEDGEDRYLAGGPPSAEELLEQRDQLAGIVRDLTSGDISPTLRGRIAEVMARVEVSS